MFEPELLQLMHGQSSRPVTSQRKRSTSLYVPQIVRCVCSQTRTFARGVYAWARMSGRTTDRVQGTRAALASRYEAVVAERAHLFVQRGAVQRSAALGERVRMIDDDVRRR